MAKPSRSEPWSVRRTDEDYRDLQCDVTEDGHAVRWWIPCETDSVLPTGARLSREARAGALGIRRISAWHQRKPAPPRSARLSALQVLARVQWFS